MAIDVSRIDAALRQAVTDERVPGAVAVVWERGATALSAGYGMFDTAHRTPMQPEAIFRIASFTKAVVAIAVLQLVEAGKLDLDAPVGSIIPAFDDLPVLEGFDGDMPTLRAPKRRATLRHLMTHTSGLTYDAFWPDLIRFAEVTGIPMPSTGRKTCFSTPLVFDPGDRFAYGMSTDWTGQVVEAVSGKPLDAYCREHVFGPLGLDDIGFTVTSAQQPRVVPVHQRQPDGSFTVTAFEWPSDAEFRSGGHGLYATAGDFLQIQLLLMHGGELGGVRLLRPESVSMMLTDQLGDMRIPRMPTARPDFTYDLDLGPGVTWGLDIMLTTEGVPGMRPAGSAGWCGTFNTFHWFDRRNDLAAGLYMQYLPLFDPAAVGLATDFERAVYASR